MLYVFGSIPVNKDATNYLIDFIEKEPSGIFTLPEAFLKLNKPNSEKLEKITYDGKKVIITGSGIYEDEKACIFAYGESESVFGPEYDQIFTIPYNDSQIRTTVRVCKDLLKPYYIEDFELICHPSTINLENLDTLNVPSINQLMFNKNLLSRIGLKNVAVASSDNLFSGTIIDPSGNSVGETQQLNYGIKCKTYDAKFRKNK